jgi:hypothetical protein
LALGPWPSHARPDEEISNFTEAWVKRTTQSCGGWPDAAASEDERSVARRCPVASGLGQRPRPKNILGTPIAQSLRPDDDAARASLATSHLPDLSRDFGPSDSAPSGLRRRPRWNTWRSLDGQQLTGSDLGRTCASGSAELDNAERWWNASQNAKHARNVLVEQLAYSTHGLSRTGLPNAAKDWCNRRCVWLRVKMLPRDPCP